MGYAMPSFVRGLAAVGVVAFFLGGCIAQRQPLVVIDPEFSYARDGIAAAPQLARDSYAIDLTVDEHGLLRASDATVATRLVQAQVEADGE